MAWHGRFFILPWDIPGKYYPLFLASIFGLMRRSWLDIYCAVGIGYAYADVSYYPCMTSTPFNRFPALPSDRVLAA